MEQFLALSMEQLVALSMEQQFDPEQQQQQQFFAKQLVLVAVEQFLAFALE